MSNISVMSLAAQKADWLAARQVVLSQNVANANTPGYKSKDLKPFEETLKGLQLSLASSGTASIKSSTDSLLSGGYSIQEDDKALNETGNSVSLDTELMKIGETSSQYSLDTNIIKSFHRMLMSSLKG